MRLGKPVASQGDFGLTDGFGLPTLGVYRQRRSRRGARTTTWLRRVGCGAFIAVEIQGCATLTLAKLADCKALANKAVSGSPDRGSKRKIYLLPTWYRSLYHHRSLESELCERASRFQRKDQRPSFHNIVVVVVFGSPAEPRIPARDRRSTCGRLRGVGSCDVCAAGAPRGTVGC